MIDYLPIVFTSHRLIVAALKETQWKYDTHSSMSAASKKRLQGRFWDFAAGHQVFPSLNRAAKRHHVCPAGMQPGWATDPVFDLRPQWKQMLNRNSLIWSILDDSGNGLSTTAVSTGNVSFQANVTDPLPQRLAWELTGSWAVLSPILSSSEVGQILGNICTAFVFI